MTSVFNRNGSCLQNKDLVASLQRVGFKKSFLRKSFWRANATIMLIVGVSVVVAVMIIAQIVCD